MWRAYRTSGISLFISHGVGILLRLGAWLIRKTFQSQKSPDPFPARTNARVGLTYLQHNPAFKDCTKTGTHESQIAVASGILAGGILVSRRDGVCIAVGRLLGG